ncbi:hypothetical protein FACS1894199_07890 [Bacteroidia bacterium]|nr:hypothetical protein FACS1894195_1360 [Bacteroidia bacterium]GHV65899.1 hypothetical protein FACS1894199_07890 [Bacteroidia bacterium]
MRKTSYVKVALMGAMVVAVAMSGCSKDENSENNTENTDTSSSFDGKIEATVSTGSTTVDTVKALAYVNGNEYNYDLASGTYINGRFSITLPATVPAKYLKTIDKLQEEGLLTISNPAVKYANVYYIDAFNGAEYVGDFTYRQDGTNSEITSGYYYVDSDVTITGSYTDDDGDWTSKTTWNNVSLKKGWNIVYEKWSSSETTKTSTYEYTTTEPDGLAWKFRFMGL